MFQEPAPQADMLDVHTIDPILLSQIHGNSQASDASEHLLHDTSHVNVLAGDSPLELELTADGGIEPEFSGRDQDIFPQVLSGQFGKPYNPGYGRESSSSDDIIAGPSGQRPQWLEPSVDHDQSSYSSGYQPQEPTYSIPSYAHSSFGDGSNAENPSMAQFMVPPG